MQTKQIAELPVLGRNAMQLMSVIPGVQPPAGQTVSGSGETYEVKMAGGMQTQNGVLTDGGESRAPIYTESSFTLPIESVSEFRVDTATYPAEYGRAAGGVVNLVTKSGTNQYHGVIYEFLRNDHLNANSWQNNRTNVKRNLFQRNEYGAAVGGRIIRDRTFFFVNYEAQRQRTPIDFVSTVPTAEQRQGDFSRTLDSTGRPVIIFDPTTTRPDPNQPGRYIRDPFPNNRIPQDRINTVSRNVMNYWPAANRSGEGPTLFNNYFRTGKRVSDTYTWVGRIDHVLTDKHRLFGRIMTADTEAASRGFGDENAAFPAQNISSNPRRSALVSLTSTFTAQLLGELRINYTRFGYTDSYDREGFDISTLGFPQSLANDVQYKTFPTISVSQYTVGTGLSGTGGSSAEVGDLSGAGKNYTPQDTYQVQYHVTYLKNRHKFKMGTDLQLLRLSTFNTIAPASRYFFDRVYTQGPDPSQRSSNSGHGFASLLLGIPVSGNLSFGPSLAIYGRYYGFYFQDDVQLTNKLTANLGLRYEYTTPWAEKWGRVGYFDFNATEPVTGAKGTYVRLQPGQYIYDPQKNNWSPRVGLAYRATSNTVVRAAGAIFYGANDTLNAGTSDWGNGEYILNEAILGAPNPLPNTPPVGGSWSNPFAAGYLTTPSRTETFAGQNLRTYNRYHPMGVLYNWTFNVQHMIRPTLLFEIGYVGSKTLHVAQNRFYNQNSPDLQALGPGLLEQVPNTFFGKIKSGTLSFPTVERRQLLRPYPQYLQFLVPRDGYGDAHYHGLLMRLDKQYSNGLQFSVAYTKSKTITNSFESANGERGPQNALYDPNYSRSLESNDVPQRLVLSFLYELPFGPKKAYASQGLISHIIGNWQFSGITVFQKGIPLRIAASDTTGLLDFALNVGRANRSKDPVLPSSERTTDRWFDTSAFSIAAPYTMPNDSLTQPRLRDPGRRNFDISLFRTQRFGERWMAQFRAEFYNLFNTPALSLGNTSSVTVNAPQFGRILIGTNPRNIQFGLRIVF
ncbi:MAG TPA: TonB-dependent receptor [Bryobacteraceae bacterium]|nr:TonB-dependent receptor [Bryobacteraceae bacterium]